jgi:hypothetical protein
MHGNGVLVAAAAAAAAAQSACLATLLHVWRLMPQHCLIVYLADEFSGLRAKLCDASEGAHQADAVLCVCVVHLSCHVVADLAACCCIEPASFHCITFLLGLTLLHITTDYNSTNQLSLRVQTCVTDVRRSLLELFFCS